MRRSATVPLPGAAADPAVLPYVCGVGALLFVACFGPGALGVQGGFTAAMLALILFKHRDNIVRLFQGRESRFEKARVLGRLFDGPRAS